MINQIFPNLDTSKLTKEQENELLELSLSWTSLEELLNMASALWPKFIWEFQKEVGRLSKQWAIDASAQDNITKTDYLQNLEDQLKAI